MPALPYYTCELFTNESELHSEVNKRGYRIREDGEVERGNGELADVLEVIDLEEALQEVFG